MTVAPLDDGATGELIRAALKGTHHTARSLLTWTKRSERLVRCSCCSRRFRLRSGLGAVWQFTWGAE